jgi:hypothetical protein
MAVATEAALRDRDRLVPQLLTCLFLFIKRIMGHFPVRRYMKELIGLQYPYQLHMSSGFCAQVQPHGMEAMFLALLRTL